MSRSPANLTSRAGLDAAGRSNVVLPLLLAFGDSAIFTTFFWMCVRRT